MDLKKVGFSDTFIAVRLHPLSECLLGSGIQINEKAAAKKLSTPASAYHGYQHFLDPARTSPTIVRTRTECNTKIAKCIFINAKDISSSTIGKLRSGTVTQI